ncbi:MAG: hypothetical protein IKS24_09430, partial [Bacteroidaceae bacterium]|nr:hypothetical protein [Bacteroidaceae bacterium]
GKWNPGIQDSVPVRVYNGFTVRFENNKGTGSYDEAEMSSMRILDLEKLETITDIPLFSYSQTSNLSKMDDEERNVYLERMAREVTANFGPDFLRDTVNPVISEIKTFSKEDSKQPDIIANDGRKYYTVTFPTKEKLEYNYTTKVDIWEDDGQPKGVFFGTGIGRHFMSKSYKEWLREGIREEDKFPYRTSVPLGPIPAFGK